MKKAATLVLICISFTWICTLVLAKEEKFTYDDHRKRDPFWRLVTSDGVFVNYDGDLLITDMILEGIIFDPDGNSLAIINGSIIKVDDKLGLFVVTKIERRKVFLTKEYENFVLELKKEE